MAPTPATEKNVLQQMQETPSMSTRSLVHAVRVSRVSVKRILREHDSDPFHMQCVQVLQLDDYAPHIPFATDLLFPSNLFIGYETYHALIFIYGVISKHFLRHLLTMLKSWLQELK